MSLSTVLEAADHERTSMEPDEWLDFLIQLRDEVQRRIEKVHRFELERQQKNVERMKQSREGT